VVMTLSRFIPMIASSDDSTSIAAIRSPSAAAFSGRAGVARWGVLAARTGWLRNPT
jgi:hypothetical protein